MSLESNDPTSASNDMPGKIDATRYAWPSAEFDPVTRMRALAASRPHTHLDEALFDVDFDSFWNYVTDFERNTAKIEGSVGAIRVLERDGDRITLESRPPIAGPWMRFQAVVRPGWCLMQSRMGEIGMSARAEADGRTRFCHFEGSRRLGRLARPVFAWNIRQDFRRLRKRFPSPHGA